MNVGILFAPLMPWMKKKKSRPSRKKRLAAAKQRSYVSRYVCVFVMLSSHIDITQPQ